MKTSGEKVGTTSVLDFIKKQQIKWFGHISRLPTDSVPQRAMLLRYNVYRVKEHTKARSRNLF